MPVFLSAPIIIHWAVVKRILRYLKETSTLGLAIRQSESSLLSAFFLMLIGLEIMMIHIVQGVMLYILGLI